MAVKWPSILSVACVVKSVASVSKLLGQWRIQDLKERNNHGVCALSARDT